jgi:hypothetical protein
MYRVQPSQDANGPRVKAWILYIVMVWSTGPLDPGGQKTVVLEFEQLKECLSIADQVDRQVKEARSIFGLKQISCLPCESLYGKERCPAPPKSPKSKTR